MSRCAGYLNSGFCPIRQYPSYGFGVVQVGCRDCHLSEARTVTVPDDGSRLRSHAKTEEGLQGSDIKIAIRAGLTRAIY